MVKHLRRNMDSMDTMDTMDTMDDKTCSLAVHTVHIVHSSLREQQLSTGDRLPWLVGGQPLPLWSAGGACLKATGVISSRD
ncbi:MAG: hypothetical protein GX945_05065 [Lentisphaerae bacterium]|nr:hypothetical protein [Lentisphaerota bacterium]